MNIPQCCVYTYIAGLVLWMSLTDRKGIPLSKRMEQELMST
jgi:hypothetical protein